MPFWTSRQRGRGCLLSCVFVCSAFAVLSPLKADLFELQSGGRIVGELVQRSETGDYVVLTDDGARITLSQKQVRRHVREDARLLEYEKRSRGMPDTVAAHRELAAWCKQQQLAHLANHHYRRILELDPDDEQARQNLGYQRHQGRWLTRDQIMAERGLRHYDGAYRTPQDIALRQREKKRKTAESDWFRQIRLWRGWLNSRRPERAAEAAKQIAAIRDPYAAAALVKLLEKENNPRVRELLTAALAELDHPLAIQELVDLSLHDPDHEVRLQCIEYLQKSDRPISLTPYVKALKHRDNVIVNRAAEALQQIGNPAAVSPLIDALVTTHKYKLEDRPSGQINASFSPRSSGGGGFSFGGGGPKVAKVEEENLNVRRALVQLSGGQDFEYNEKAWRRWFINQQTHSHVDARRDQ